MSDLNEPAVPEQTLLLVGPVFLGAITSWLIFGISIVQLYIYYISFPNDRLGMKLLVYWVFILDIFLTVVAASMGWHILCAGWGRQTNLVQPGWTFAAIGVGDGTIATTVQIFYAWRIWVLKQWRVVPVLIICIALVQWSATTAIGVGIANLQDISELLPFFPKTILWLGGGTCADILIAVSMVYLLTTAKKNSHALRSSDRAINRLIRLSVETGSITATFAIMELGFFLGPATKTTNIHLFFALILGKVYSNTMMTSLNSRISSSGQSLSRPATENTSASITDRHNFRAQASAMRVGVQTGPTPPVVSIATHTEVFADERYKVERDDDMGRSYDDMEMMDRKPRNDMHHLQSFSPV